MFSQVTPFWWTEPTVRQFLFQVPQSGCMKQLQGRDGAGSSRCVWYRNASDNANPSCGAIWLWPLLLPWTWWSHYDFFFDKIIHCGLTLDELFETIRKQEVINVRLDEDDAPQLIIESLNSTGLDLSEADKIRNYLLMSLASAERDDLYSRFWNSMEEFTKYEPSSFVRDYLS